MKSLPQEAKGPIKEALRDLLDALNRGDLPGPPKLMALKGSQLKRLKVGEHRVILDFDLGPPGQPEGPTLWVVDAGHRREVYRKR